MPRPPAKPRSGGHKRPQKDHKKSGGDRPSGKPNDPVAALIKRMDQCPTAESLNNEVLMPFITAMEKVCSARGYVLNVYGDTANVVFSGDEEHAEAIYQIVDAYLDDQNDPD
jgi:hypothetical protein